MCLCPCAVHSRLTHPGSSPGSSLRPLPRSLCHCHLVEHVVSALPHRPRTERWRTSGTSSLKTETECGAGLTRLGWCAVSRTFGHQLRGAETMMLKCMKEAEAQIIWGTVEAGPRLNPARRQNRGPWINNTKLMIHKRLQLYEKCSNVSLNC